MSPQAAALHSAPSVAFEPPPPVSRDRLIAALASIDPGSRALLDLSVRWQVADERVARLLRTDAGDIARRRAGVMEGVAGALGVDPLHGVGELRTALAQLPAEAWGVPVPESARAAVPPGGPSAAAEPRPVATGPDATAIVPSGRNARNLAAMPTGTPASVRSLPALAPRRGRTVLALAVGAFLGAVLGRRFR